MWCYQKPGFGALVLTELQKQQQSSQFCDTVLKTDGVSVPVHSCVLSALSPQFLTSLAPAPDLGQKRFFEFGSLGKYTLLHLVRLLYSGEMVGVGEREKQEAFSAAAKLGIHGLVEVSHIDREHRKVQGRPLYTEVGVQTDSKILEENQVRVGGWRREVRDGATLLWRERLPICGNEMWTQTQDLPITGPYSSQPPVTYETIDINALQSLCQTEPLQIPYVPMSVYPSEDNHGYGQSSLSTAIPSQAVQHSSVQNNAFSLPSQALVSSAETPHWGQEVGRAAEMVELAEDGFEQFEGNIPGFINYFLSPEHEEGSHRKRGRRKQRAGAGGVRHTRTRARGRARGRGGLTQTVVMQDVGVSKLSKMYLQRWGMFMNGRTGQGGGAVGRRLYVKTREFVRSGRSARRRTGRGIDWDLNRCVKTEARNHGQRSRPRTAGNAPQQVLVSSQRLQRSIPSSRGPEQQPEQIDLLLEEVMVGLDILPNNTRRSEATLRSSRCGAQSAVKTDKRQSISSAAVPVVSRCTDAPSLEVPVLQQQNEGEINDILDQFLLSFERLESAAAQSSESREPHTNVNQYRKHNIQLSLHTPARHAAELAKLRGTPGQTRTSIQSETSGTESPMETLQTSAHRQRRKSSVSGPAVKRPRGKKRVSDSLSVLEKPKAKSQKAAVSDALNQEQAKQQLKKQLRQNPVVKLERTEFNQSPGLRSKKSPSATSLWGTKTYPIRSRIKTPQLTDISLSAVEEQMYNNEDKAGSDTREPKRRGDEEMSSVARVKRICLNSEPSIFKTMDAEVIDVETISLNSTSNTLSTNNIEAAALIMKDCSTDTERESNDVMVVDSLDESFDGTGLLCSLRAGEAHDLDSDVDVVGGSSPVPAPVLLRWTDSHETESDTDTDVPEEQTVVLSKGRLVRR